MRRKLFFAGAIVAIVGGVWVAQGQSSSLNCDQRAGVFFEGATSFKTPEEAAANAKEFVAATENVKVDTDSVPVEVDNPSLDENQREFIWFNDKGEAMVALFARQQDDGTWAIEEAQAC